MAITDTARLRLHPVDVVEAIRIHSAHPSAADRWADGYPFEGDLEALGAFLSASKAGEQRPFGYYQIAALIDGLAIGGIGFFGPPVDGVVEVGYGLVPDARGSGYAAEALLAILAIAAANGVHCVVARSELDNVPSYRTLITAGFEQVHEDGELRYFERKV
jgi:RimJ/RimL family protein N-acetyltransferase